MNLLGKAMERLETTITVDAPRERVWEILMNFSEYSDWNPFIVSIRGMQEIGARLSVVMRIDHKKMTLKPEIITLDEPVAFEWIGALLFKGLFSGKHMFYLKKSENNKTLLRHAEEFRGWLVPFLWPRIKDGTTKGFEAMNQALKQRAEQ
jgi:hypothetical protein